MIVSSLTEEVVRRLKHTRRLLPDSHRLETLEDLSQKMINSGHKPQFIKRIISSGIAKYERMVSNSQLDPSVQGYKPLHEPSGRCKTRLKKKTLEEKFCTEVTTSKTSIM